MLCARDHSPVDCFHGSYAVQFDFDINPSRRKNAYFAFIFRCLFSFL
uniref:Uncharacterized protein n=1 Tax=Anguilla anguilla TaxID=7936 RepID=A0A0E9PIU1_ANGAN